MGKQLQFFDPGAFSGNAEEDILNHFMRFEWAALPNGWGYDK